MCENQQNRAIAIEIVNLDRNCDFTIAFETLQRSQPGLKLKLILEKHETLTKIETLTNFHGKNIVQLYFSLNISTNVFYDK